LQDAEKCCELKPDWDKAHCRKAAALEASEKDADALIALEVRKNSLTKNLPSFSSRTQTRGFDPRLTPTTDASHRRRRD